MFRWHLDYKTIKFRFTKFFYKRLFKTYLFITISRNNGLIIPVDFSLGLISFCSIKNISRFLIIKAYFILE